MRQLFAILFVLIFAVPGNSQAKDFHSKQFNNNLISIYSPGKTLHQSVFYRANFLDEPDSNDLDSFNCVSILPDLHRNLKQFKIFKITHESSQSGISLFNELLFDLPPPVIAICWFPAINMFL